MDTLVENSYTHTTIFKIFIAFSSTVKGISVVFLLDNHPFTTLNEIMELGYGH